MTIKTRKILFYSASILFIVIGVIAIFYSNGWRFDPETMAINKLGALFFEIKPDNALISIDKTNFKFDSSFLRSGTIIANLFPKKYTVKISKEGYQTWIKELEVRPSLVTQAPPVILLPEKINFNPPLAKKINNFWLGPKYLIVSKNNALEFNSQIIIGSTVSKWSADGEKVITASENEYFTTDLAIPGSSVNLNLMFENLQKKSIKDSSQIKRIDFSPANKNQYIILTLKGLYAMDIKKYTVEIIRKEPVDALNYFDDKIIFSVSGKIFIHKPSLGIQEPLLSQDFGNVKEINLSPSGYYVSIINDSNDLYIFNRKSLVFLKIAENAVLSSFSPDSQKITFINTNNEIQTHILEFSEKYAQEKPSRFNFGSIEKIIIWYKDSSHLFIKYPTGLYLLETSSLPPINLQLVDLETDKFQYSAEENTVYLLRNGDLYKTKLE